MLIKWHLYTRQQLGTEGRVGIKHMVPAPWGQQSNLTLDADIQVSLHQEEPKILIEAYRENVPYID